MSSDGLIGIRDWEQHQHRDVLRGPGALPWIKLYTRLHHSDEWMALSGHRRAVLVGLWIEYASSKGRLANDTASLSRRLALRVTRADLEALELAGYIEFLPAPCQPRKEEIRAEQKRTHETRRDQIGPNSGTSDFVKGSRGGGSDREERSLDFPPLPVDDNITF